MGASPWPHYKTLPAYLHGDTIILLKILLLLLLEVIRLPLRIEVRLTIKAAFVGLRLVELVFREDTGTYAASFECLGWLLDRHAPTSKLKIYLASEEVTEAHQLYSSE